ncbi:MAG: hypothetical protein A2511_04800 [Deltaproteobacteria bacterium RIFOXYD12_FULL_50_9]|nr:MAG: hypothetical protein A2511_04800 [Deltaproteobacteria bacterium RIFOXYD12_FULL_50_9]
MDQFNHFTVALKNLRRKPFRSGVLVLAIALLVALLIFAMSFTKSLTMGLHKASERLGADLVVVPVGARGFAEEFLLESKNTSFYMAKSLIDKVRKVNGVESITYQTYLTTIPGMCCDVIPTRIVAFDPETDFIVKPWLQKAIGRELKKGEALAGFGTNENFGLGLLDVSATIYNNKFKMVGVLEQTGTGLDNALFMTEENLADIIATGKSPLKSGEISVIFVKFKQGLNADYMGKVIEGQIPDVDVITRSDMGARFLSILADINKIFLVTTLLSSILTIFLVWSIFSAIANERSREIGIMRAIGATQADIVKLFLLEVLILGLAGSLAGVVSGTFLSILLVKSFTMMKNISVDLTLLEQTIINAIGLLAGCGICITGALMPINRLKKLEPLLAIKEE